VSIVSWFLEQWGVIPDRTLDIYAFIALAIEETTEAIRASMNEDDITTMACEGFCLMYQDDNKAVSTYYVTEWADIVPDLEDDLGEWFIKQIQYYTSSAWQLQRYALGYNNPDSDWETLCACAPGNQLWFNLTACTYSSGRTCAVTEEEADRHWRLYRTLTSGQNNSSTAYHITGEAVNGDANDITDLVLECWADTGNWLTSDWEGLPCGTEENYIWPQIRMFLGGGTYGYVDPYDVTLVEGRYRLSYDLEGLAGYPDGVRWSGRFCPSSITTTYNYGLNCRLYAVNGLAL